MGAGKKRVQGEKSPHAPYLMPSNQSHISTTTHDQGEDDYVKTYKII